MAQIPDSDLTLVKVGDAASVPAARAFSRAR